MTDRDDDGMFSPDGWGVYHHWVEPVDDVHGYMFGPFPTYDIAKAIKDAVECKCETSLVPLMFPKGIIMMAGIDGPEAIKALGQLMPDTQPPLSPIPDRVH